MFLAADVADFTDLETNADVPGGSFRVTSMMLASLYQGKSAFAFRIRVIREIRG
jgi:hypothetical protein